jgi:hypothetical protein
MFRQTCGYVLEAEAPCWEEGISKVGFTDPLMALDRCQWPGMQMKRMEPQAALCYGEAFHKGY